MKVTNCWFNTNHLLTIEYDNHLFDYDSFIIRFGKKHNQEIKDILSKKENKFIK